MTRIQIFFHVILFIVLLHHHHASATVLTQIGRHYIEDIGYPGAEAAAIDTTNNRIFTADGYSLGVNVLSFSFDLASQTYITFESAIYFESAFLEDVGVNITDVTSIELSPKGWIVAAVIPYDYAMDFGWLAFINTDLEVFHLLELDDCYLPDHVISTSDGSALIVSCEGEPDDNEAANPLFNPRGSISVINTTSDDYNEWIVENIGFEDYDVGGSKEAQVDQDGIYITHQNELFSINAEPEYCAISDDDKYAYIALQEQNAIAIVDIMAKEVLSIHSLGYIDYSVYGLDASDKDDMINIQTYPNLLGYRAPDAIDYLLDEGRHYLFTANEGDTKDFDESRVKDLNLSATAFAGYNLTELQKSENLGRLKVSNLYGQNDDGEYETLYSFNSRDFTIWEVIFDETDNIPNDIELVYSSMNIFETVTAEILGTDGFNSNYYNPSFDDRSDAKGPEPEAIVVGKCDNGQKYVFISMERSGGIFVFNITELDDGNVEYVEYFNSQNYSVAFEKDTRPNKNVGDIGPEHLEFIPQSAYGVALLLVSYPESSSIAVYYVNCGEDYFEVGPSTTEGEVLVDTGIPISTEVEGSEDVEDGVHVLSVYASYILFVLFCFHTYMT